MAANQLDGLVAPIALYPDPLISQILVAATYPLELVEANQWLQRNSGLSGQALTQAAQTQNWDPSVQAMVMFPELLKRLTDDINWTTDLGNAFLSQQQDVMSAVQRMRLSAQQDGKLSSTPQQQVLTTTEGGQRQVVINPVNPEVIYVPEYDPYWVWGPSAYYPYPNWYYPRRSGFFFGVGIGIGGFLGGGWGGWGGWGWHPGWGGRTVIVNNTFIHRNNFNSAHFDNRTGRSNWNGGAMRQQGFAGSAPMARSFTQSRSFAPSAAASRSFAQPSRSYAQSAAPSRSYAQSAAPSRSYAQSAAPSRSYAQSAAPSRSYAQSAAPSRSYAQSAAPSRSYAPSRSAAAPMARSAAPSFRGGGQSSSRSGGGGGQHSRSGGGHGR